MRIAHVNGAPYEAEQHAPIALKEGVIQEQIDVLGDWHASSLFSGRESAALACCDEMTKHVHVTNKVFADAKAHFDNREIVELTATIGAYNMVSRFLEARGIDLRDGKTFDFDKGDT